MQDEKRELLLRVRLRLMERLNPSDSEWNQAIECAISIVDDELNRVDTPPRFRHEM